MLICQVSSAIRYTLSAADYLSSITTHSARVFKYWDAGEIESLRTSDLSALGLGQPSNYMLSAVDYLLNRTTISIRVFKLLGCRWDRVIASR